MKDKGKKIKSLFPKISTQNIRSNKFKALIILLLGTFVLGNVLAYKLPEHSNHHHYRIVRRIHADDVSPAPSPTLTPEPTKPTLSKSTYVIAAFGDSMVDTMGEHLEYLDTALHKKYPGVNFKLYNYGIGSQTVEMGLNRWNSSFSYQTRNYPPITDISPDVIVLGSFSYNPFLPHDANKHFLLLIQLVQKAKETNSSVYLLAEMAPLYDKFGQGPHGPNMTLDNAHAQADRILEQLESIAGIASSQGVGFIDAFTPTQVNGKYGDPRLVNTDDGIHPSIAGQEYVAEKIASRIVLK